jgi:hypothetical protein
MAMVGIVKLTSVALNDIVPARIIETVATPD